MHGWGIPDRVEAILGAVFAAGFALVWLSRRFPDVAWLEPFRFPAFQLTEAQRARNRRFATTKVAVEIMIAGIAVPLLYLLSKMFMFDEPTMTGMLLSVAAAVGGIAIGITLLIRNR